MATNEEIQGWLAQNPNASAQDIYAAMNQYGVTMNQLSQATGQSMDQLNQVGTAGGLTNYQLQNAGRPNMAHIQAGVKPTDAQISQQWNQNISTATGGDIANQMRQYGLSTTDMLRSLGSAGMGDAMNRMWRSGDMSKEGLAAYQQQQMGGNDPEFSSTIGTPWQSYGLSGSNQGGMLSAPGQPTPRYDTPGGGTSRTMPTMPSYGQQMPNMGFGGSNWYSLTGGQSGPTMGTGQNSGYSLTGGGYQNPRYQQNQLGFGYSQPRYSQQGVPQQYQQGGMYGQQQRQQPFQQYGNQQRNMGFGQNTANATTSQFSGLNGRGLL